MSRPIITHRDEKKLNSNIAKWTLGFMLCFFHGHTYSDVISCLQIDRRLLPNQDIESPMSPITKDKRVCQDPIKGFLNCIFGCILYSWWYLNNPKVVNFSAWSQLCLSIISVLSQHCLSIISVWSQIQGTAPRLSPLIVVKGWQFRCRALYCVITSGWTPWF